MAITWKFRQNGQETFLALADLKCRKLKQFYNYVNISMEKWAKDKNRHLKKDIITHKYVFVNFSSNQGKTTLK